MLYVVTVCCFLQKKKKKSKWILLVLPFSSVLSLKALCTTSHLRVHTYLHTVMTSIQGATYPSRATRGSVTAFTCTAQSDNSILLLRMGWRAVSSQSLHAGEIIGLSATACLPLASRLTFQDTARRTTCAWRGTDSDAVSCCLMSANTALLIAG